MATTAPLQAKQLLAMPRAALHRLFHESEPGEIPEGRAHGTILALPGTPAAVPLSTVLGTLVWRGKVFHPETRDLKNLLTPLSIPAIRAEVRPDPSWLDGRPCIVLDYSQS